MKARAQQLHAAVFVPDGACRRDFDEFAESVACAGDRTVTGFAYSGVPVECGAECFISRNMIYDCA